MNSRSQLSLNNGKLSNPRMGRLRKVKYLPKESKPQSLSKLPTFLLLCLKIKKRRKSFRLITKLKLISKFFSETSPNPRIILLTKVLRD